MLFLFLYMKHFTRSSKAPAVYENKRTRIPKEKNTFESENSELYWTPRKKQQLTHILVI